MIDAVTKLLDELRELLRVGFFGRFLGDFAPAFGMWRRGMVVVLGQAAPPSNLLPRSPAGLGTWAGCVLVAGLYCDEVRCSSGKRNWRSLAFAVPLIENHEGAVGQGVSPTNARALVIKITATRGHL